MTKVYIRTFGCSANFHDSEIIAGLLKNSGYDVIDALKEADIIIINACTVKGETKVMKEVRNSLESKKRVVVAGCFTDRVKDIFPHLEFIGTNDVAGIAEFLEKKKTTTRIKINLPKLRKNPVISIVPISSGCVNKCSYCSVKLIKGELQSYPEEKIIEEVKQSVEDGCKEIWITSQDNSVYGLDIYKKLSLPKLLEKIIDLEGDFFIRIGMMNPDRTMKIKEKLVELLKSNKVFKFIHIPVQSGSNRILKLMNRNYTKDEFIELVEYFRKNVPKITISTDIIVGFPTETEEEFLESIELIKKIKPDVLNRSRFIKREGTAAEKLKQIPGGIIKNRSKIITNVFDSNALIGNQEWIGWQGCVLIDEKGKNDTSVGRNIYYKPVVIKETIALGKKVDVMIKSATNHYLRT
jgi:threonylcarbamoyladenosine tRNA methylthiotransferase CDKAL1